MFRLIWVDILSARNSVLPEAGALSGAEHPAKARRLGLLARAGMAALLALRRAWDRMERSSWQTIHGRADDSSPLSEGWFGGAPARFAAARVFLEDTQKRLAPAFWQFS